MTLILLTLVLGGSLTEHQVTDWQYDAGQQLLVYEEGGVLHAQYGICCVQFSGATVDARTDGIFADSFD